MPVLLSSPSIQNGVVAEGSDSDAGAGGRLPALCAHGDVVAFLGCEMRHVGAGGAALDACIKGCLCLVTFFLLKGQLWKRRSAQCVLLLDPRLVTELLQTR